MKKKIISSLAFVILAAGILLVVFLPGNKKATKHDGTSTSADDNHESIFLTIKNADVETDYDESQADKIELSDSMTRWCCKGSSCPYPPRRPCPPRWCRSSPPAQRPRWRSCR